MKVRKFAVGVLMAVLLGVVVGCAEDRTYQLEEKTSGARWIESSVEEWYLWADSLPELAWKDYFLRGDAFLKKLTSKLNSSDKWSYCAVDTTRKDYHVRGIFDHLNSYGMDVVVMTDPTGVTSRQYARVVTVVDGSPAARCGLKRNDFIGYVGEQKVSSSNVEKLAKGLVRTLVVSRIAYDLEQQMYYWERTDTVSIERSEYVEDEAFPLDTVYSVGASRVGYLMCNRLVENADEVGADDDRYRMALDRAMGRMKSAGVAALIVDLRLCNYGELEMVSRMAAYITGRGGVPMLKTEWKARKSDMDETIVTDASVAGNGLGLERVYFITSAYTQGAAEWLVHGMESVLGANSVFTIGVKTAGQNVLTYPVTSDAHSITLHLAAAYMANAEGEYGYGDGVEPDMEVNEFGYADLYPYGDLREVVLSEAMKTVAAVEGF